MVLSKAKTTCGLICLGLAGASSVGRFEPTVEHVGKPTAVPIAGKQIQSLSNSLCVDLPGGDTSNGALLWMWECSDGSENQQWSFQDNELMYKPDTKKCVDLLGGNTTNGNMLGLWDCYQGDSQHWQFDSDSGRIYLASSESDATKCMDIDASSAQAGRIRIWDCTDGLASQTWKVLPLTPEPIATTAKPVETTTKAPQPAATTTGAPQPVATTTEDPEPVETTTTEPVHAETTTALVNTTTEAPYASGQIEFLFTSKVLCVDLPGGDTSNGALLWMWECSDGSENQQWSFQDNQLMYKPDTKKCVDLLGGDTTTGNRIGLWECNNSPGQSWEFDSDAGMIYLASTPSASRKCMEIGGTHVGDPIQISPCSMLTEHKWKVGSALDDQPFLLVA